MKSLILITIFSLVSSNSYSKTNYDDSLSEWFYKTPQKTWKRPANFYKIEKSLEDSICNSALEKLNEEAEEEYSDSRGPNYRYCPREYGTNAQKQALQSLSMMHNET